MNDLPPSCISLRKAAFPRRKRRKKIRAATAPASSHTDIDYGRLERTGCPEVIYGAGKTPDQIEEIARGLLAAGQNVLATRLNVEALDYLNRAFPEADMHPEARLMRIMANPVPQTEGFVGIVSAGTSDQSVAEEAALTAEFLGSRVLRYRDCGVAGLAPPGFPSGFHPPGHRAGGCGRHGRSASQRAGRAGKSPRDRRTHQRGLRSQFPRSNYAARHDELLRQRRVRRQYRQRFRGRIQRSSGQQPGVPAPLNATAAALP